MSCTVSRMTPMEDVIQENIKKRTSRFQEMVEVAQEEGMEGREERREKGRNREQGAKEGKGAGSQQVSQQAASKKPPWKRISQILQT